MKKSIEYRIHSKYTDWNAIIVHFNNYNVIMTTI